MSSAYLRWAGQVLQAVRVVRIDNTGPKVAMTVSPSYVMPFVMNNVDESTVTVTYVSGPPITSVTFYKELADTSVLIGTVSSAPWVTTVTAYEVATGGSITIKAVVFSSPGASGLFVMIVRACGVGGVCLVRERVEGHGSGGVWEVGVCVGGVY